MPAHGHGPREPSGLWSPQGPRRVAHRAWPASGVMDGDWPMATTARQRAPWPTTNVVVEASCVGPGRSIAKHRPRPWVRRPSPAPPLDHRAGPKPRPNALGAVPLDGRSEVPSHRGREASTPCRPWRGPLARRKGPAWSFAGAPDTNGRMGKGGMTDRHQGAKGPWPKGTSEQRGHTTKVT